MQINKLLLLFSLSIFHVTSISSFGQELVFVREIINAVNLDTLKSNIRILTGEIPVNIDGIQHTIKTRHSRHPENELAEQFIYNKLNSYGLEVIEHSYGSLLKNIYAVQNGKDNNQTIIISAHFDSCGNYSCDTDSAFVAPGADDNASGVSATLECARIISKYLTNYKIIYAFWDAEEQGLIGSKYYATNNNENIIAVINLDMIGWDSNNDGLIEIHAKDTTASNFINLPNLITEVNNNYNIGLQPILFQPGTWRSDHYSFWQSNDNAVLLIEGLFSDDFNKYYHSQNDKLENFNLEYFQNASKLAIASIATIAEIQDYKSNIPSDYFITQNYPNPFNSETHISFSIPTDNYVSIIVYDILGRQVETLVADYFNGGNYEISFKANHLSSGLFIYTMNSGKYRMSKKMMYLK